MRACLIFFLIGRYQAFASCRFDAGPQKQKEYLDRFFPSAIILMNTARKIFPLITLQKQQASANTTLPDYLSSLQIPPITNTLIAKELIMPCCSYPIPIFLSRRQHFSLVSPVFPPFFASSVLSNNVRLRNSAICIFIRKNCRKILIPAAAGKPCKVCMVFTFHSIRRSIHADGTSDKTTCLFCCVRKKTGFLCCTFPAIF